MAKAIEIARDKGARKIFAVGTHAILIGNAVYTLLAAGVNRIIGTDTMDTYAFQVSMSELIAKAIAKHDDEFDPNNYPNLTFCEEDDQDWETADEDNGPPD